MSLLDEIQAQLIDEFERCNEIPAHERKVCEHDWKGKKKPRCHGCRALWHFRCLLQLMKDSQINFPNA